LEGANDQAIAIYSRSFCHRVFDATFLKDVLKELNPGMYYVMYQEAVKIWGDEVPLTFVYPCFDYAALLQRAQNLPAKPCEPTMDIDIVICSWTINLFSLMLFTQQRDQLCRLLLLLYPTFQLHPLKRLTPMKTFATLIDYVE